MALRPSGAPPVTLRRAGRELAIPTERPVVLRHQDELVLEGMTFCLHVHGTTDVVHAPRPILSLPRAAIVAAAVAFGSGPVSCGARVEVEPPTTLDAPGAEHEAGGGLVLDGGPGGSEPAPEGAPEDAGRPGMQADAVEIDTSARETDDDAWAADAFVPRDSGIDPSFVQMDAFPIEVRSTPPK